MDDVISVIPREVRFMREGSAHRSAFSESMLPLTKTRAMQLPCRFAHCCFHHCHHPRHRFMKLFKIWREQRRIAIGKRGNCLYRDTIGLLFIYLGMLRKCCSSRQVSGLMAKLHIIRSAHCLVRRKPSARAIFRQSPTAANTPLPFGQSS